MNKLFVGSPHIKAKQGFLLVDDGPVAQDFLKRKSGVTVFDPLIHSFNPIAGIDEAAACDFVEMIYPSQGSETLTVRNGKWALTQAVFKYPSLDEIRWGTSDAQKEAKGVVEKIRFFPVLESVFCGTPNFSFDANRSIVAVIDRAQLGEFAATVLGLALIAQGKGQIIIPDFEHYGRPFHKALIRQNRLMAGVPTLSALHKDLRGLCMRMEKIGSGVVYEDALELAKYKKLRPDPLRAGNDYDKFIDAVMA